MKSQDAITKVCNFKMQLHLSPPPAPPLVPPLISSLIHWLAAFSCLLLTSASVAPPLVLLVTLQVQQPLKNVSTEKEPANNDRNILHLSTFSTAGGLSAHVPPSAVCQVHDPWTVGRGSAQMTQQRGARALVELLMKIAQKNCLKQCSQQFFSPIAKDYFEWLQSMEGKGGEKNNGIMKGIPYSDSNSREQVILHF